MACSVVISHLLQPELSKRRERHRQHDGRAVRVGDDPALPAARGRLAVEELEMVGVHLGNHQRHVRVHAVVSRVADDEVPGGGEGAFDFSGDRRVEPGEHQLRRAARRRLLDGQSRDIVRRRRGQTPRGGVAIGLALRTMAGAEPGDLEPRVVREERDELLADHAGRAEDANFDLSHDSFVLSGRPEGLHYYCVRDPNTSWRSKKKADAVASAETRLVDLQCD